MTRRWGSGLAGSAAMGLDGSREDREPRMVSKKSNRRQSGQPTISDVAKLAQCSPMTVSRVINEIGRASCRERV